MKAKLIKKDDGYNLVIEQPQGRLLEATCSPSQQLILDKSGASTKHKLSKQNCDELFGSYNPKSMMKDILSNCSKTKEGYILGFQMAMALNKDKLFTLEDMIWARDSGYTNFMTEEMFFDKLDMHNQQPTEIDVEIVMRPASLVYKSNLVIEELDSEGCLILKKI